MAVTSRQSTAESTPHLPRTAHTHAHDRPTNADTRTRMTVLTHTPHTHVSRVPDRGVRLDIFKRN